MMDTSMKVVLATGDKLAVWDLNTPAKISEIEMGFDVTSLRG